MHYTDSRVHQLKHHPRVCSNCYRFLRHEDPLPERIAERQRALTPERTATMHTGMAAPPGPTVSDRRPRRICDCGVVHPFAELHRSEPLDTPTLVTFTDHLSATARELAREHWDQRNLHRSARWTHDKDVLFRCVRHLKATPQHQFQDDLILAASFEVACAHAPSDPLVQSGPPRNKPGPNLIGSHAAADP